jgi:ubiquinone/menaquinone biosynthesis C-methylase UbiE
MPSTPRARPGADVSHTHRTFIPAAGWDLLLPLYDPLNRVLGVAALHDELIAEARLEPGQRVLDVGCGTGSLAVRIRSRNPRVDVVGLDPDAKALAIARRKAERARVDVRFEEGYGDALPFEDACFDRVTSSLMLHHLELATRRGMLREARRVLRPGGSLHLLDFGWSGERTDGLLARLLHSAEHLRANSDARVAQLIGEAGFDAVERVAERRLFLGRVAFHSGCKASAESAPSAIRG